MKNFFRTIKIFSYVNFSSPPPYLFYANWTKKNQCYRWKCNQEKQRNKFKCREKWMIQEDSTCNSYKEVEDSLRRKKGDPEFSSRRECYRQQRKWLLQITFIFQSSFFLFFFFYIFFLISNILKFHMYIKNIQ